MKVEVNEVEALVHHVSVVVEADQVNPAIEQKLATKRSETEIKGFRKGKAPMDQIRKNFEDEIKAQVADEFIKETIFQAIQEKGLKIAIAPTLTEANFTDDGSLAYTARVEVFPEISSIVFDGLEVLGADTEATDDDVSQMSKSLQNAYAEFRTLDREVQAGDTIVADLKKLKDPKLAIAQDSFPNSEFDLSSENTLPEFRDQLPGMKVGETREVTIKYADDYPDKKFAGAEITYGITLNEVRERILPEFDDALAKKTGQAETALELRLKMREEIKRQKDEEVKKMQRNQIIEQICEKNAISLPPGLIEQYLTAMVEDVKKQNPDAKEEEIRKSYKTIAESTLRWNLLRH